MVGIMENWQTSFYLHIYKLHHVFVCKHANHMKGCMPHADSEVAFILQIKIVLVVHFCKNVYKVCGMESLVISSLSWDQKWHWNVSVLFI